MGAFEDYISGSFQGLARGARELPENIANWARPAAQEGIKGYDGAITGTDLPYYGDDEISAAREQFDKQPRSNTSRLVDLIGNYMPGMAASKAAPVAVRAGETVLGAGPAFKQRVAETALDMAPEARAQRASDMGFGDKQFYHATGRDFGAFDVKEAGTGSNAGNAEKAIFLTDNPAVADTYLAGAHVNMASPHVAASGAADTGDGVGRYYNEGSQVMPLRVRGMDDFDTWDMGGAMYDAAGMKQMLKEARAAKSKGVVFENMRDPGIMSLGKPKASTVVAVLDPSYIRSPHAAFNPAKAKSKDLLAASANPLASLNELYRNREGQ